MEVDFIGAGLSFPVSTDATGGVALVTDHREIEQAVRLILGTSPGERPMRPEFGCRIHEHVFGSADVNTAAQIAFDVRAALDQWEPRITVEDVRVTFGELDPSTLYVDVHYVVRGRNDPRNLVFPFYVIPEEPSALSAAEGG